MKRCIFIICAWLIVMAVHAFKPGIKQPYGGGTSENPYLITNASELYWFQDRLTTNPDACAKLVADITLNSTDKLFDNTGKPLASIDLATVMEWTPMASYEHPYTGTFDGNGHIIHGLYCQNDNGGLFRALGNGAVIKRLTMMNALITEQSAGAVTMGCIAAEIIVTENDDDDDSNNGVVISQSTAVGALKCGTKTSSSSLGGIVGRITDAKVNISDGFFDGQITTGTNLASYGVIGRMINGTHVTVENYFSTFDTQNSVYGILIPTSSLESGLIAWYLNHQSSEAPVWFQRIATEKYPHIGGSEYVVYYDAQRDTFSNDEPSVPEDRMYINSVEDLLKFARLVNNGNETLDAQFTSDIDMKDVEWSPIGTREHPFRGIIWGEGHVIKNLQLTRMVSEPIGFIGCSKGGSVEKLGIEDASFLMIANSDVNVGLLCGEALADETTKKTKISECYARGQMVLTTDYGVLGGLCGLLDNGKMANSYAAVSFAMPGNPTVGLMCGKVVGNSDVHFCSYLNSGQYTAFGQTEGTPTLDCVGRELAEFQSGAVAFYLKGLREWRGEWQQQLGVDEWPRPKVEGVTPVYTVYQAFDCQGGLLEYTNIKDKPATHKTYDTPYNERGFSCQLCEANPQPPSLSSGKYIIKNAGNLYWVAQNNSNDYDLRIDNDIVVNDDVLADDGTLAANPATLRKWIPMTNSCNINGNRHVISGLYCVAQNAALTDFAGSGSAGKTISSLGIEDSYMAGQTSSSSFAVAYSGTIDNSYSTATLVAPSASAPVGGFVNRASAQARVAHSYYSGHIIGGTPHPYFADDSANPTAEYSYSIYEPGATDDDFTSGRLTWILNGENVGNKWFQRLVGDNPDLSPKFTGTLLLDYDSEKDEYFNITMCDGQARRHAMTFHACNPRTCLRNGCEEYYDCSLCDRLFRSGRGFDEVNAEALVIEREWDTMPENHTLTFVRDFECTKGPGHEDYYHCEVCGNNYREKDETSDESLLLSLDEIARDARSGHDCDHITAVAPTCITPGVYEHWTCKACHRVYADEECTEYLEDEVWKRVTDRKEVVTITPDDADSDPEWELLQKWVRGRTTYTNVLRTTIGNGSKTQTFHVPETKGNSVQLMFSPISSDAGRQPFTLKVNVNGIENVLHVVGDDVRSDYDMVNFASYVVAEGSPLDVSVTIVPVQPVEAADCKMMIQVSTVATTHQLTAAHLDYDCLDGGPLPYYTCDVCNYLYSSNLNAWSDKDRIDAPESKGGTDSHGTLIYVPQTDSDCGNEGNVEYWMCKVCGTMLQRNEPRSNDSKINAETLPKIPTQGEHDFSVINGAPSMLDHLWTATCSVCRHDDMDHRYIKGAIGGTQNICLTDDNGVLRTGPLQLPDGTRFFSPVDFVAESMTYTRTFASRNWFALFLPFDISYSDWADGYDVAELHNVHQYTNSDGDVTRTVLEYVRVSGGTLKGGCPYVIRAKNPGSTAQVLQVDDAIVRATTNTVPLWCASTKRRYNFIGTYSPINNIYDNYYIAGDGYIYHDNVGISLKPLRWYMQETDHEGNTLPVSAHPAKMMLTVINDNLDMTGVVEVVETSDGETNTDVPIYDLAGRRTDGRQKGIYIRGNRKYMVR